MRDPIGNAKDQDAGLIGPGEAGRRLGVSGRTVQRWLRDGRLPAVRVGQRLKVPAAALGGGATIAVAGGTLPFRRVLVANRGELVVRIAGTCRRLGITCVGLVTEDQRAAWWATQADDTVDLAGSYLDPAAVIAAARSVGADAIHPGYGFLAERPDFAEAVTAAGIAWVGPPRSAMRAVGDKAAARRLAARLGLPILPGYDGAIQDNARLRREAARIGYPILLKPSAGGGGKGMHVVREAGELRDAIARARREAQAAFGDGRLVLERYLDRPRHVEIQVLCDAHGGAIHLGERDCSLQRRHQKVIEEAPAPHVSAPLRSKLGDAALTLARSAGYVGAGTVEFLLDETGEFVFMELNARLQVEHPVTEAVTGIDLVEQQLRIAAGERLAVQQRDVRLSGHAIEARLYAEDPWNGFLPASGTIERATWPTGESIRVDAGVASGDLVGTRYDPLLAKIVAWAPRRDAAMGQLDAALGEARVLGLTTNRGFLRALLATPEVRRGDARTDTIGIRWHPVADAVPPEAWHLAGHALDARLDPSGEARVGFRLNGPRRLRVRIDDQVREVPVGLAEPDWPGSSPEALGSSQEAPGTSPDWMARDDGSIVLDLDGRAIFARLAEPPTVAGAVHHASHAPALEAVRAPMPGIVLAVRVRVGETVEAHDELLVLEAMKMENSVPAVADGRVERVLVRPGQAVQRGDVLVELA